VRQHFTQKERDNETGLDYFLTRYYSSTQGRFTSTDEFKGGPHEVYVLGSGDSANQAIPYALITNPQSLNKYQYAYNNPGRYVDDDGHCPICVAVLVVAAVAVEILLAPDTVNAPGPNDRTYQSGDGVRQLLANNAVGVAGGSLTKLLFSKVGGELLFKSAVTTTGRDAVAEGEALILQNAATGKAFQEQVHGIIGTGQNFERLVVDGSRAPYRVPDLLTRAEKVFGEIKSQKYLSNTGNLKDFISYAKQQGFSFNLYVRRDTVLSMPLRRELRLIGAKVYNVVDGRLIERKL